jgi:hypothetical protein
VGLAELDKEAVTSGGTILSETNREITGEGVTTPLDLRLLKETLNIFRFTLIFVYGI